MNIDDVRVTLEWLETLPDSATVTAAEARAIHRWALAQHEQAEKAEAVVKRAQVFAGTLNTDDAMMVRIRQWIADNILTDAYPPVNSEAARLELALWRVEAERDRLRELCDEVLACGHHAACWDEDRETCAVCERDRLRRILAVEQGDESQAPEGRGILADLHHHVDVAMGDSDLDDDLTRAMARAADAAREQP